MPSFQVSMKLHRFVHDILLLEKKVSLYSNIMGLHNVFVIDSSLPNLGIFCFG
jgi:hypothetical protein